MSRHRERTRFLIDLLNPELMESLRQAAERNGMGLGTWLRHLGKEKANKPVKGEQTVDINITITDSQVAHLLCSAREGGANYWADFLSCPYTFDSDDLTPLKLPVKVRDREDAVTRTLDRNAISRGILALADKKNADTLCAILKEDTSGSDGDSFLQLCLFGDVIYG